MRCKDFGIELCPPCQYANITYENEHMPCWIENYEVIFSHAVDLKSKIKKVGMLSMRRYDLYLRTMVKEYYPELLDDLDKVLILK